MPIEKAIILSAGKGSRLLPLTADRPKCLIELAGKSLLEWQLDVLQAGGIGEIVVVTGFADAMVDAVVAGRAGVRTLFNPFFQVADNLGSVWVARGEFDRDTLLLNGDTLISPALLARVLAAEGAAITVTVDEKSAYDSDDMKVLRDGARLLRIGKALAAGEYDGESIGLLAFRGDGGAIFIDEVERMMRTSEGTRRWYLRAIDAIARRREVMTVTITGEQWQEVDFPADLAPARLLTEGWAKSL